MKLVNFCPTFVAQILFLVANNTYIWVSKNCFILLYDYSLKYKQIIIQHVVNTVVKQQNNEHIKGIHTSFNFVQKNFKKANKRASFNQGFAFNLYVKELPRLEFSTIYYTLQYKLEELYKPQVSRVNVNLKTFLGLIKYMYLTRNPREEKLFACETLY